MADVSMFGLNPGPHHVTSVILHAANSVLLFLLLRGMTRAAWPSALVAALFAIHPLHVESVAWVAERKDVLSTLFALATLRAYHVYVKTTSRRAFWAGLGFFALGLMAKPMLVSLPILMVLLDHWPLERHPEPSWRREAGLLREKLPFFLLSLLSCIITVYAQSRGPAIVDLGRLGLGARLLNAGVAYARYLVHMAWPADLAILYPSLPLPTLFRWAGPSLLLLAAITWAVARERQRRPYLLVGWLWFLISLVPVIGLVQVGGQAMADRYTYLPLVGPFMSLAWLVDGSCRPGRVRSLVALGTVLILAILARRQVGTWRDSITVFRHCQATAGAGSAVPAANIALAFLERGRPAEALLELDEGIRSHPAEPVLRELRGEALLALGRQGEAADAFLAALDRKRTDFRSAWQGAQVLARLGRDREALACFRRYLELEPLRLRSSPDTARVLEGSQMTRMAIGLMLVRMGRMEEALTAFKDAQMHGPRDPQVLVNLGIVLAAMGRPGEALEPLAQAAALAPGQAVVHVHLGLALAKLGHPEEAAREITTALGLDPSNPAALAARESLRNPTGGGR
jgi:tetratricopeptide (TPR) repeat protein